MLFALAGLARQTTLVFPFAYAVAMFVGRRRAGTARPWLPAAALLVGAALPYIAWSALCWAWLGSAPTGQTPQAIPFIYLFDLSWAWSRQGPELLAVVAPALLWLGVILALWRQGQIDAAAGCALIGIAAFIVFGPNYGGYPDAGRGGALAAAVPMILAYPLVVGAGRVVRWTYRLGFAAYMVVLPAVVLVDLLNIAGNRP